MDFWSWFWRYDYSSPDCPYTQAWVICKTNGSWFMELSFLAILTILMIILLSVTSEKE